MSTRRLDGAYNAAYRPQSLTPARAAVIGEALRRNPERPLFVNFYTAKWVEYHVTYARVLFGLLLVSSFLCFFMSIVAMMAGAAVCVQSSS